MTEEIKKFNFDKTNLQLQKACRKIFRESWPLNNWLDNIPYPGDTVYAFYVDNLLIGFCMVHNTTPPPVKPLSERGAYMYNLCVSKTYRHGGVAKQLLQAVVEDNSKCYIHMPSDHHLLGWVTRHGWQEIGSSIHNLVEYSYGFPSVEKKNTPTINQHYDPDENVIYL